MYLVVVYFSEHRPNFFRPKNITYYKVSDYIYIFLVVDYLRFVGRIRKKYKNHIKFINVLRV